MRTRCGRLRDEATAPVEMHGIELTVLELVDGRCCLSVLPDPFEQVIHEPHAKPSSTSSRYHVEPDVSRAVGVEFVVDMAQELAGLIFLNEVVTLL